MSLQRLKEKYNTRDGRVALNRALRAEQTGGPELLDSIADINAFFDGRNQTAADARKVLHAVKIKLERAADQLRAQILAQQPPVEPTPAADGPSPDRRPA